MYLFETARLTGGQTTTSLTIGTTTNVVLLNTNGTPYFNVLDATNESDTRSHTVFISGNEDRLAVSKVGQFFLAYARFVVSDEGTSLDLYNISPVKNFVDGKMVAKAIDETVVTLTRTPDAQKEVETARKEKIDRLKNRNGGGTPPTNIPFIKVGGKEVKTLADVATLLADAKIDQTKADEITANLTAKGITA
jgi:hypothetical protein